MTRIAPSCPAAMDPENSEIMSFHPNRLSGVFNLPPQRVARESKDQGNNATDRNGVLAGSSDWLTDFSQMRRK
jgi:hypothetical protein